MSKALTPSQTIGPFYWGTLVSSCRADLAPAGVAGERIEVALTLHDAEGAIVPDGLLEIWQANSHGRYNHPEDRRNLPLDAGFEGFGRVDVALDDLAGSDQDGGVLVSHRSVLPPPGLPVEIAAGA